MKKNQSTKKLEKGHYLHLSSRLHIICNIEDFKVKWSIYQYLPYPKGLYFGIPTKRQCIERIEKSF
jgi:hypothetical protein